MGALDDLIASSPKQGSALDALLSKSPEQPNWLQRTVSNIPESAAGVWESMKHPERDIEAAAQAGTATGEYLKSRWKDPSQIPGDIGALGSAIVGGVQNLPQTVEKDPVGAAVNLGLIAVSPEGAAGRALGVAGKVPEASKFLEAGAKRLEAAKGVTTEFPRESFSPKLDALKAELKATDYDPKDHPLVAKALKRVEKDLSPVPEKEDPMIAKLAPSVRAKVLAKYPDLLSRPTQTHTFRDLVKVRKSKALREARKSPNAAERDLAYAITEHLDDYESSLGDVGQMSKEGRALYSRGKKLETLQALEDKAQRRARRQHYGLPHARSLEFEKIASNPAKLRTWTPAEQERIKLAAQGGGTAQWLANKVGRFAIRGPMMGAVDIVMGHFLPLRGAELAAAGEVGRQVERSLSKSSMRELRNLVGVGGDEEKLTRFATTIGPKVADDFASTPAGKRAIAGFIKKPTPATARIVAVMLGRRVNRPDLVPRIQQELENMDQDNNGRTDSLTPAVNPVR